MQELSKTARRFLISQTSRKHMARQSQVWTQIQKKIRIHSDPCTLVFREAPLTTAQLELLLAKNLAFSAQ